MADGKTSDASPASPDASAQVDQEDIDVAALGETEFSEQSTETDGKPSSDEQPGADSTASPVVDPSGKTDDSTNGDEPDGDEPSPDDADQSVSQLDEVDEFLQEMHELKEQSEKDGTDVYSERLKTLAKDDPVRARLWRSESRVKGLQQGYQRVRQERRQYEKEAEKLKAGQEKAKLDGFQELSPEELEELDKEEYAEYMLQKKDIETRRDQHQQSEETGQQVAQLREFEDFLYDEFQVEFQYGDDGKLTPESVKQLDDSMSPQLRQKVDDELERVFGKNAVYNAEQIKLVYHHVNRDNILLQERTRTREQLKANTEAAARGQTRLDSLPTQSARRTQTKKLEETPIDDIQAMGESEFNTWAETAN